MLKSFKTEIRPTAEQRIKIHRTIGCCRYIYNFYLAENKSRYDAGEKYLPPRKFSVWLNNEYLPEHPECGWLKEVSTKSIKHSLENAGRAFTNFWKYKRGYPRFKKKRDNDVKMYFVRNEKNHIIPCERHRIKIPTLGWMRIKEKGYIPTSKNGYSIINGCISMDAGRYYVSVLIDVPDSEKPELSSEGIGIDLGLKDLAILSNGTRYKNINKTAKLRRLEKQLKREQRCLSRKYEALKKREGKGKEKATRQNIQKQILRLQRRHKRITDIRTDYINQCVSKIVKTKPSYITIEDLNVSGMMKNRHLSKAVASQKLYEFGLKLRKKCADNGIELRVADRFYASSKTCHCCGMIRKDLKLSDRVFRCECGYTEDRDYNASLNLRDTEAYKTA